jgi:hypothetical protein
MIRAPGSVGKTLFVDLLVLADHPLEREPL